MRNYKTLEELVNIDSPSGFTANACKYIFDQLAGIGYKPEYTNKGAVKCALGSNPTLAIAAHVDTLGAIVSGIKKDGNLNFSPIGGLLLTSAEGEYVNIITLNNKIYTVTCFLIIHRHMPIRIGKQQIALLTTCISGWMKKFIQRKM